MTVHDQRTTSVTASVKAPTLGSATAALIYLCDNQRDDGTPTPGTADLVLAKGPLPFHVVENNKTNWPADDRTRMKRFDRIAQQLLYGDEHHVVRQHRDLRASPVSFPVADDAGDGLERVRVVGVEILWPQTRTVPGVFVVLHCDLPLDARPDEIMRGLVPGHGLPDKLLDRHQKLIRDLIGASWHIRREHRVATATHVSFATDPPPWCPTESALHPAVQWATALATLNRQHDVELELHWARTDASLDLSPMVATVVAPDAVSLVTKVKDDGSTSHLRLRGWARTLDVDVLLLSLMQRYGLSALEERLASVGYDLHQLRGDIRNIEMSYVTFRNEVWWEEVSPYRPINELLAALQSKQRTGAQMAALREAIHDSSLLLQNSEMERMNHVLLMLTLPTIFIGLPAAVILGAAALIRDPASDLAVAAIAAFVVSAIATGLLLWWWWRRATTPELVNTRIPSPRDRLRRSGFDSGTPTAAR